MIVLSDDLRIDSHKLIYHPERVTKWINGDNIYPITIETALSGGCNHRCTFCALDYTGYNPIMMDKSIILNNFREMAKKGVKSVVFAGEGEPLLNRNAPYIINCTKEYGIDTSMSTNGVLFTKEIAEECMKSLTWIRFSVAAGTNKVYKKIHKSKDRDFERVLKNLNNAVEVKRKYNLETTLGVQLLMIPDNVNEVMILGKELKKIGVDYFTVKPFSKHPKSICDIEDSFVYNNFINLEKELQHLETEDFKIYFRSNSMKKLICKKNYDKCYGLPFFTYIDAKGNVVPCIIFLGDKSYYFGNINEESFVDIWEGKKRKEVMEKLFKLDVNNCRELCRLDNINEYLCNFKAPSGHINFI